LKKEETAVRACEKKDSALETFSMGGKKPREENMGGGVHKKKADEEHQKRGELACGGFSLQKSKFRGTEKIKEGGGTKGEKNIERPRGEGERR